MGEPLIAFDGVWKKFRRGEHHDSLRDLIPALARRLGSGQRRRDLASDEFWVLRNVSFDVRPGQALGIIGPNGAGKSTALKLLTRILRPTKGVSRVQGRVGALIEIAAGFHPDLTGRENVYLQGAIMGMSRADVQRRFDAIVDFAGIPEFVDTPVKRYSSGMNARLGFAIAANLEPDVLLIDEVLAVGDLTFQQRCYSRLNDFRAAGVPIVFVSHNMPAIASFCDRVLLLRTNELPFIGDPTAAMSLYTLKPGTVDSRVHLRAASVTATGSGVNAAGIQAHRPGTVILVDLELEVSEDLLGTLVGLEVTRADGVVVFNGGSMPDCEAILDLRRGSVHHVRVTFDAHLLKGMYTVSLHLVDQRRLWRPVTLPRLGSFILHETSRVAGYAELYPRLAHLQSPLSSDAEVGSGVTVLR